MAEVKKSEEFADKSEKITHIVQGLLAGFAVLAGVLTAYPDISPYFTISVAVGLIIALIVFTTIRDKRKSENYESYLKYQLDIEKAKLSNEMEKHFTDAVQAPSSAGYRASEADAAILDKVIKLIDDTLSDANTTASIRDGYTDLRRRVSDMKRMCSRW